MISIIDCTLNLLCPEEGYMNNLKPGVTFWSVITLVVILFTTNYLVHLHDPNNKPKIVPGVAKATEQVYHFYKKDYDRTRVITPEQVKLAASFGPKVYKYAQAISAVNNESVFPSNRLLLAIAATESSFREDAESSSSVGLLQINYKAHNLERDDLFDVKTNVKTSIHILKKLHKQCKGDVKCTILSYNVGHKAYINKKYNIAYYNKVMKYMNM